MTIEEFRNIWNIHENLPVWKEHEKYLKDFYEKALEVPNCEIRVGINNQLQLIAPKGWVKENKVKRKLLLICN